MKYNNLIALIGVSFLLFGCAGSAALQPDRAIFNLDDNYKRFSVPFSIEESFERTTSVFKEAGYRLDVVDRATGQISGRRGATGDKGASSDKDLKIYVLVLPDGNQSEVRAKIVQIIQTGPLGTTKAEIIVSDEQMYRYLFARIANYGTAE
ncbi:MAG: hypothetical protein O9283_11270 [Sphingomonadaceae bacterium]|jgi:hypothetical protein|nr:hypothetical protein [Sphingomonadaceae bacterium]